MKTTGSTACALTGRAGIGATEPLYPGAEYEDRIGLPDLPPPSGYPVEKGGPIIDGLEGPNEAGPKYDVSCSISGSGELRVDLEMSGQNTAQGAELGVSTTLKLTGSLANDGTGTASVTEFSKETQSATASNCVFTAVPNSDGDPDMGEGHAFATFVCEGVTQSSQMRSGCTLAGTVVLDYCETN